MSRTELISINLNKTEVPGIKRQSGLWFTGLLLLVVFWSVGFYVYQNHLREHERMTNLLLREEINGQNQLMTEVRPLRNSDQVISKHERIQNIIHTIEPQADKLAEIEKMVTPEVLLKSIDISGKRIIISGCCGEYSQLAMMIERIDQGGAMAIVKSECTQSPSDTGFDFVVEADWIKT